MIAAAPFEGDGADFCAGLPFEEGSPTGGGAFFVQPVLLLAALLASSKSPNSKLILIARAVG